MHESTGCASWSRLRPSWPCSAGRPALAADQLYVPLLTYRTGAFAGSGIPIADGMHDYLEMLNQRDGGIGGVKIAIDECETGYDAQEGRRVLRGAKGKGPSSTTPTRPASRCS